MNSASKRYQVFCSYDPEMESKAIFYSSDEIEDAIKAAQDKFKEVGPAYYGIFDCETKEFVDFNEEAE